MSPNLRQTAHQLGLNRWLQFAVMMGVGTLVSSGLTGCTATTEQTAATESAPTSVSSSVSSSVALSQGGIPPVINADHWHAAYGMYVCDRYLPNLDGSTFADPDGIHAHDDGLIHIHPFTENGSGKNAILRRFTDVMGIKLTKNSLNIASAIPPVAAEKGDACPDGKKGEVSVVTFSGPDFSRVTKITDPLNLRFEPDQILAFVFAPADAVIPPPPSIEQLDSPLDAMTSLALTKEREAMVGPVPIPSPGPATVTTLTIEELEVGAGRPAALRDVVGVKYQLTSIAGNVIDTNWSSPELLSFPLGREAVIAGFEQGITGMKVGGLRRVIIPSALAYGVEGSPPNIAPNQPLVFVIRLVAFDSPKFVLPTTVPVLPPADASA